MKKVHSKSFKLGLLIGTIVIIIAFAGKGIRAVEHEKVKVSIDGTMIPLENSLSSGVKEHENDEETYMTVKAILEYLGYDVEWNDSNRSIDISTKTTDSTYVSETMKIPTQNETGKNVAKNETDKEALEIMQKTGNWSYVEHLFPSMTSEGVEEVVALYIKKTGNYKQAEEALIYINTDNSTTKVSPQLKSQSDYDTLAGETLEKTNDIYSIMVYMPHMSTDKVDTMVKDYIDKTDDFNCIYAIRQYISTEAIDNIVKSYVDRKGDYGTVAAMLQFMSADASKYVAQKYINESKDQQYRQFFTPYL